MFIRQEGDSVVMAEMEGPGCIWRIWSALAEKGHVKIYLDGGETPAVDLPFENYFSGDTPRSTTRCSPTTWTTMGCRGQNLYFPIPYQKSCKIVAEKGWGRLLPVRLHDVSRRGRRCRRSPSELARRTRVATRRVSIRQLGAATDDRRRRFRAMAKTSRSRARLLPGKRPRRSPCCPVPGRSPPSGSRCDFDDREDEMAALRELCLQITFDGQEKPAVWCPLGDFFGTAPGVNLYKCCVTGMTEDGFYAYWYMPFAKRARGRTGQRRRSVARSRDRRSTHAPLDRPFDGLGHFHCKWHRDTVTLPEDRWPDWTDAARPRGAAGSAA